MFNGDVKFYVMDAADPVLRVYRKAFPGVFKTLSELPPDLKAHLRYPEDIFAVQANQYKTFHMKDPQVFYNREDLWAAPTETYAGEMQRMSPTTSWRNARQRSAGIYADDPVHTA